MQDFLVNGPLGTIECIVEPKRGELDAVLVMAHGFRGSRESGGRAAGVAKQLAAFADVVRFNFTGTQPLSRQVAELQAVLAEIRRQRPHCRLLLLGRSLGGAASIVTAAQDQRLSGLVLWATPNNLRATFRHVMTPVYYDRLDAGEALSFTDERGNCTLTPDWLTDFDNYDLEQLLRSLEQTPVLLLHCEGDTTVLVEQARRNAEVLGSRGKLKLYPGGDHSFTEYSEQAGAYIADWLENLLKSE